MDFQPERRQTTRVECCYQVECSHASGNWQASVVDMGLGGLRLRSLRVPEVGEQLVLQQSDHSFGDIQVEVVWTRLLADAQREFGVVYRCDVESMERSWVKDALRRLGFETAALYERRRHVRRHTTASATLEGPPGLSAAATILDLGLGGALIETALEISAGNEFQLRSPLLENSLHCRVIYCRQAGSNRYRCGLSFEPGSENRLQARLLEGYLGALD